MHWTKDFLDLHDGIFARRKHASGTCCSRFCPVCAKTPIFHEGLASDSRISSCDLRSSMRTCGAVSGGSSRKAFRRYCETMRWVLKKEPFNAIVERMTWV